MYNQRTIKETIACVGIGLHTGKKVSLKVRPAPVNTGVIFIRTDLPGTPSIKACVENVVDTNHATTLGIGSVRISTVEHLMASLAGLGIDNVFVEVNAPEIPIMDGSAAPFVFLLRTGGIKVQNACKRFMVIKKPMNVGNRSTYATIVPSKEFKLSCTIDFSHPMLRKQSYGMTFSDSFFEKEISRARTFCFLKDVETLRERGLVKGGSLDSAVVIDDFRIINEGGLRYENEFVRHKMLDTIGDLSLLGMPVIGYLSAQKTGHALNHELTRKILASPEAWNIVEVKEKDVERLRFRMPQLQDLGAPVPS